MSKTLNRHKKQGIHSTKRKFLVWTWDPTVVLWVHLWLIVNFQIFYFNAISVLVSYYHTSKFRVLAEIFQNQYVLLQYRRPCQKLWQRMSFCTLGVSLTCWSLIKMVLSPLRTSARSVNNSFWTSFPISVKRWLRGLNLGFLWLLVYFGKDRVPCLCYYIVFI